MNRKAFGACTRRVFLAATSAGFLSQARTFAIRVGCQANAYPLKEGDFDSLLRAISSMKSLGYEGFECNIRFVRAQFTKAAAARETIAQAGMQFIGAHTSMREAANEDFAQAANGAAQQGACYIVMSGAPAAAEEKASQLNALGETCKKNGIQLAYHNHQPEFANGNAEINALAAQTDPRLVKFLVDAGHAYQGGGDPAAFLLANSNRIVGFHIKTFLKQKTQVPLGHGDFGFEGLAAEIKKTGWSGWLIDEEGGGPSGDNPAAVGPDREYIRKVFGV
jgi:sugar phosphate isomerase/epimerase